MSAPCDDLSTARITFVGADPGGYALLEPVPAGADAAFRFVVPDVAPGRYRIFFECTGFEAFEIAGGFEVRLGAPDTATLTRSGASDNPAPIFLALAAVVGAWVGTRRMGGDRSMSRR